MIAKTLYFVYNWSHIVSWNTSDPVVTAWFARHREKDAGSSGIVYRKDNMEWEIRYRS